MAVLRADSLTIVILLSTNWGWGQQVRDTQHTQKKTQRTRTNDNVPRDATAKVVKVEIFTRVACTTRVKEG